MTTVISMSGEAKACTRGCCALVYFDKNSTVGHPSRDKWVPLEMKGNLRTDMAHNCPKRSTSGGTLDSHAAVDTKAIIVKPELLETAQGLFEVLQDYIRLKRHELATAAKTK